MDPLSLIGDLATFGTAGLMGALWLWERKLSRLREEQLTAAHDRILRDEARLRMLTQVVEQNTSAISRFGEIQRETIETLRDLARELRNAY